MMGVEVDNFGFPVEATKPVVASPVLATESVDAMIVSEHLRLEREKMINAARMLEAIESKLLNIQSLNEAKKSSADKDDAEQERSTYDVILSDEALERFSDGLLTVLGELESEKLIPEIESATQAKDALLAVIRQLFQRKDTVGKMSRKFARFGAKQFLKRQRALISKSI